MVAAVLAATRGGEHEKQVNDLGGAIAINVAIAAVGAGAYLLGRFLARRFVREKIAALLSALGCGLLASQTGGDFLPGLALGIGALFLRDMARQPALEQR